MKNLILLHGALGSEATLAPLAEKLRTHYHIYTFDFPGHGRAADGTAFSTGAFATSLADLIEEKGLESYSIFGYSMGGYVALIHAAGHPSGLEQIITLGTKMDWSPETAAGEVRKLNHQKISEKVPQFAAYLDSLHNDWKLLMERTAGMMLKMGEERGLCPELLGKVNVPVLMCRGSEDQMVTNEETDAAVAKLKNGTFRLLEGVQHPIDRVDPQMLGELIRTVVD